MRNKILLSIVTLSCFTAFGQKGLESKMKTDTTRHIPSFKSRVIKGNTKQGITKSNFKYPSSNFIDLSKQAPQARPSGNFKVAKRETEVVPYWITLQNTTSAMRPSDTQGQKELTENFITSASSIMNAGEYSEFEISKLDGKKTKLIQTYKGVEVYQSEVLVHFNGLGQAISANGNYINCDFELDVQPTVDGNLAINTVQGHLATITTVIDLSNAEKIFSHYDGPSIKKVVYQTKGYIRTQKLAYEIKIKPNVLENWTFLVDANTGKIILKYNQLCSADGATTATATDLNGISRTINTYLQENKYYLADASKPMFDAVNDIGYIYTLDAFNTAGESVEYVSNATNNWANDPTAVSAHHNASIAYDYFYNNHGRNSINGEGGDIYSIINVTDDNGQGMDNAYWNGSAIFYGNGLDAFKPLAAATDVAGHELSHGVVQNTANLEYQGESGALNESMADIFGFMMDSTDWTLGEDVVKLAYFPSGALRDLSNPNQGGTSLNDNGYQPMHVSQQYFGTQDNGGVHINSGIPNHAFYLLATATSNKIGASIFYKALEEYLTRSSDFQDLRAACIQSAKDLYGGTSIVVTETIKAFDEVGIIGDGTDEVIVEDSSIPVNSGDEFILSVDIDSENSNTLYTSNAEYDIPLSTTPILNRPSVTDDGKYAYYVGTDNKIYRTNISDINNPTEVIIDNDPFWDNVAISKDGTKFAGVSTDIDTSIYVYDFGTQEMVKYQLYNPTFTEGIKSGGPLFADAIEWDYTGEYLIYDAYNEIQNNDGENITYWDVGFIKIWDNDTDTFGDGETEKLFSNLPFGVSVVNPSFSKNSPYIIAFDYIESINEQETFEVIAFNIELNDYNIIFENNTLGTPSYSRLDDKMAFTAYDNNRVEVVAVINLNADKISPSGDAYINIETAQWGVFYTLGDRDLIINGVDDRNETSKITLYPNPFDKQLHLETELNVQSVSLHNLSGIELLSSSEVEGLDVASLEKGVYIISVHTIEGVRSFKMIKE